MFTKDAPRQIITTSFGETANTSPETIRMTLKSSSGDIMREYPSQTLFFDNLKAGVEYVIWISAKGSVPFMAVANPRAVTLKVGETKNIVIDIFDRTPTPNFE